MIYHDVDFFAMIFGRFVGLRVLYVHNRLYLYKKSTPSYKVMNCITEFIELNVCRSM
jgi:hypothetical protein